MKKVRTSGDDSVLEEIKETFPFYKLSSYENLVRIKNPEARAKISHPSRFWNERSREVLNAVNDINDTFYHFPVKQKLKIVTSKHYERLLDEIFLVLDNKIFSTKDINTKQSLNEFALMMKLSERFLKLGLKGIENTMPDEFDQILEAKIQDIMLHVQSITKLTERMSGKKSNEVDFNFKFYTQGKIRDKF
jgi:hypothetical protein